MKISNSNRQILLNEIEYVLKNMKANQDAVKKVYYFSAIYGCAHRLMNIEFDAELAFIHHITSLAYNMINTAITSIGKQAGVVTIPDNLFEKLELALNELHSKIEENEHTYSTLEKIANIAYATTGNGYYLYLKGKLLK